jgi:hypothetical protein
LVLPRRGEVCCNQWMEPDGTSLVVGVTLVVGLVVFLVGAGGWRLGYDRPLAEALPLIHAEPRRRAWIHLWMIPALFITPAGLAGLVTLATGTLAVALTTMAATVYVLGAVCWIASLAFRLTVVPWGAERAVEDGEPPGLFVALDRWAGSLYVVHMASAYVAFALAGAAVLAWGALPGWVGWLGVGGGLGFLAGFVATRFSGPFNPPAWAHTYTALLGVMLLTT